jgi:hypothetical protein
MNSEHYEKVLEDHHLPFMIMHGSEYFLQDGAPCHASKKIKTVLEKCGKSIGHGWLGVNGFLLSALCSGSPIWINHVILYLTLKPFL